MIYNPKDLRQLVDQALTEDEFTVLCYDHFRAVYKGFSAGMSRNEKTIRLVDYCERHNAADMLLCHVWTYNKPVVEGFLKRHGIFDIQGFLRRHLQEARHPDPDPIYPRQTYQPGSFVNRAAEVNLIIARAVEVLNNQPVDQRTFLVRGEMGVGKTWLLAEAYHRLHPQPGFCCMTLNLSAYTSDSYHAMLMHILEYVARNLELDVHQADNEQLSSLSDRIMEHVKHLLTTQVLVIFVDEIDQVEDDPLRSLELHLLAPIIRLPRTMLVIAERHGRERTGFLTGQKLRTHYINLLPFATVAETQAQLDHLPATLLDATRVHAHSQGNPLVNYILAMKNDVGPALDSAIASVLPYGAAVRARVETLSILRSFDVERLRHLLATYHCDESYLKQGRRQMRLYIEELVVIGLAWWANDAGAYVFSESMRQLVNDYLRVTQPDAWRALHSKAHALYKEWAQVYPNSQERWLSEADHHRAQLDRLTKVPEHRSQHGCP